MSRAVTLEVNVAFARRSHRPAGKRELHAAPALEATDVRHLHAGRTRGARAARFCLRGGTAITSS